MNITQNSIRKKYYFVPKNFVQKLTLFGSSLLFFHFGNRWNFFNNLSRKIEERVSYEDMKKACLNFVGEMLFDNFAKINFSKCFNDILTNPEASLKKEREIEIKNQIVQDYLKKVLEDKKQMEGIKNKFVQNLKRLDLFQNILNSDEFQAEISIFLRDLLTSYPVVSIFCEMLDKNSIKIKNSKEFNKNISSFTDRMFLDDRIREYALNKFEEYASNRKSESNEMKKVNKELIEMINDL
jgi:hypothetical protein